MTLTEEMLKAFEMIENTTDNVFITGKAGTGKTTLLKYIIQHTEKNLVVAAPTGVAAINADGVTLHSLFNIPLGVQIPEAKITGKISKDKFNLYNQLDVLVIDEVSMLRPDILDYIDCKLRICRFNPEPFGGVQIVFIGDLFQLPPVIKKKEQVILEQWYPGNWFFHSIALRKVGFKIVELTHVFRQKDQHFIDILNRIREYKLLRIDVDELSELRDNRKSRDFENKSLHICSLRRDVDKINAQMLGEYTHTFTAVCEGKFNIKNATCDEVLKLRVGARVMALANDMHQGFCNGSMGTVEWIVDNKVGVLMDSGIKAVIEPTIWTDKEYEVKNNKIKVVEVGHCVQLPLTLGWAITIHKSQGLTFDNVTIHCPYVFAPGMLYVALSRCTTLKGITTDFFITKKAIAVDRELVLFNKSCAAANNNFNIDVYRGFCRRMARKIDEINKRSK